MAENVQVSNAEQAPESAMGVEGFFEALDTQVNGAVLEQTPSEPKQTTSVQGNQVLEQQPSPVTDNVGENLQKRYSDSSREAKRLNGRLSELEPYLPILDAMREDPNLISHVRNYFEGGGQAPVTMKERLNLGEEFMFDPDDAMSNPESDSAKLLSATIDGVVQKRLNSTLGKQQNENKRLTREAEFRQKYEMADDQWSEFVQFAKNKTLQLDDIYYLMNKGTREQNIARNANEQVSQQMKKVQQRPQSLASTGSQPEPDKTPDDRVFDEILGTDSKLEEAFGF
tara:strand:+ start:146 stop:997 length:852 start_codon:yes stop_codon:yes gene_type:complete